jgi:hypothetical protein
MDINEQHITRFIEALSSRNLEKTLYELAVTLREEGVTQIPLFCLFEHFQIATSNEKEDQLNAILNIMDLIWSGPWAKGHGLFPTQICEENLRAYKKIASA